MNNFDKKLRKILDTVAATTTAKVQRTVEEFLRRGYERWTPARDGTYSSALAYMQAFDFFIRRHPLVKMRRIGFKNLDEATVRGVLNQIIARRGRTSHYDTHILKTLIQILTIAGETTTGHRAFLQKIQKVATTVPRPHIKARAESFRNTLTEFCLQEISATPCHGLVELRDKAVLQLLMRTPFRSNTIRSLKRSDLYDDVLSIPCSGMKTRKSLGFKLPHDTLALIQRYMDQRSDDCEYLFVTMGGQPLSHNALYKAIRKRTERVLKQRLGVHDARRVVGTVVARLFDPQTAANLLAIDVKTLQRSYDLSDSSDRLQNALLKITGDQK